MARTSVSKTLMANTWSKKTIYLNSMVLCRDNVRYNLCDREPCLLQATERVTIQCWGNIQTIHTVVCIPYFREYFQRKIFFFELGLMYCDLWWQYIKVRKLFKYENYSRKYGISSDEKSQKKRSFSSSTNFQYFYAKISWIGSWVNRIDWCRGHSLLEKMWPTGL